MAIALEYKVDLKIDTGEKISVYPITVFGQLGKDKEEEFEEYKKSLEQEIKEKSEVLEVGKNLNTKLRRLQEDIEDLTQELDDPDLDYDEAKELRVERRELRKKERKLEDKLEAHNKEHDLANYQKIMDELTESIAKKQFEINVKDNEKSQALVEKIKEYNIKYSVIAQELGTLIQAAQKKKKKRS